MRHKPNIINQLGRLIFDPRFWVCLLFIAGLPTLDMAFHGDHSWRQALTAIVARNFYEVSFNPFYPLYDICGETSPDLFATEFPFLQCLIALGYFIFGEEYWIARLVNWSVSCLGFWYFSRIVDKIVGAPVGLYAMLCLIGSIIVTFSRKLMPDTFSIFLVIIGTYYLWQFLENGNKWNLIGGWVLTTLGILSKIPAMVLLSFLVVPFLKRELLLKRKSILVGGVMLTGVFVAGWYFYWMPHLQSLTQCPPLIYPSTLAEGWKALFETYPKEAWFRFEWNAFYGHIPLYLFFIGVGWSILQRQWSVLVAGFCYSILFFLFVLKTGNVFPTHTYYIIPYIPLMAYFIGNLLHQKWVPKLFSLAFAIGLTITPLYYAKRDVNLFPNLPELKLNELLTEYGVALDDLIMINNGWGNPSAMYYTKRRGWSVNNDILERYQWMTDYREAGLKYIVVDKRRYGKILPYSLLFENETFLIYDVSNREIVD